jgi:hypothetical protein
MSQHEQADFLTLHTPPLAAPSLEKAVEVVRDIVIQGLNTHSSEMVDETNMMELIGSGQMGLVYKTKDRVFKIEVAYPKVKNLRDKEFAFEARGHDSDIPNPAHIHEDDLYYLLQSYTQYKYQAWFAQQSMAPRVFQVQGFKVLIPAKHNPQQTISALMIAVEMEPLECTLERKLLDMRTVSDLRDLVRVFQEQLPNLLQYLKAQRFSHADFHLANLGFIKGALQMIDFGRARPFADPEIDIVAILKSLHFTVRSTEHPFVSGHIPYLAKIFCKQVHDLTRGQLCETMKMIANDQVHFVTDWNRVRKVFDSTYS